MSQNDYTIANQTTPLFRADLNSALQALASNSSGATAPATTYANMFWYDTAANTLYMRSEADDVWIRIGVLNQSTSKFEVEDYLGFTPVQQGGGAGQGDNKVYIGWSGSELKAQVDASDQGAIAFKSDIPAGIGVGQTWQAVSRSANVWYQNTTGRSIVFQMRTNAIGNLDISVGPSTSVFSTQGWGDLSSGTYDAACVIIPPNHYYKASGGGMSIASAQELR
jgi:hypothetical protein